MFELRRSQERGHFDHGWLNTYHTFSFADYQDPKHMNFRKLRVINEDFVAPGEGFLTHSHRDMEIVTYILQGALQHKDSMGNGSVIKPGDVQRMSAGTGVTHSEFNPSASEKVHLLQIWILPEKGGLKPSYEQVRFEEKDRKNRLCLIASNRPREGSVTIHQDADVYASLLDKGKNVGASLKDGRHAWLQVTHGTLEVNKTLLETGDGLAVSKEKLLDITARKDSELLLFDLA